jgi:hypothetical protein
MGGTTAPADAGCISISTNLASSALISERTALIAQALFFMIRKDGSIGVSFESIFTGTLYMYD